ncbi:MAG TPA: c-type cytochrome [Longimicrobiaceae bacterium]|nr:c-type cytochrome [Longimicrobiaceae bacterium]
MRRVALLLALALCALPAAARAQQGPQRAPTNLQVLPKDIPHDSLIAIMRGFTNALGVRCSFCHVMGPDGGMEGADFAADTKPEKRNARVMLQMVRDINSQWLPKLPDRSTPPVGVGCITCHRGMPVPTTIDRVLGTTLDSAGATAAIARYRQLRTETMERGTYDFGEGPVSDVARRLAAQGKTADAAALLEMNSEFHPQSAAVDVQLGDVYRARGERDKAIVRYRMALEKQPNNQMARRRLDELTNGTQPHP